MAVHTRRILSCMFSDVGISISLRLLLNKTVFKNVNKIIFYFIYDHAMYQCILLMRVKVYIYFYVYIGRQ